MRRAIALGLLAAALLTPALPAAADEAAKTAAAEELLLAMGIDRTLEEIQDNKLAAISAQQPGLIPYKDTLKAFLSKHLNWEALKESLIAIYAAEFSTAELKELTAFYRTPTGKKLAERTPTLKAAENRLYVVRFNMHGDELREMITARERELTKAPPAEAAPPPAPKP
jgi:hypothetical protein